MTEVLMSNWSEALEGAMNFLIVCCSIFHLVNKVFVAVSYCVDEFFVCKATGCKGFQDSMKSFSCDLGVMGMHLPSYEGLAARVDLL